MNPKSIVTAILWGHLILVGPLWADSVLAESGHMEAKEEVEKGPNNGRMLRDGDFAIELAIFEDGAPPEFRVFATKGNAKIPAKDVEVNVQLERLGDVIDDINFYKENNYLRGDMEIYEPHSFVVTLIAKHQGKTHRWSYNNFEGRVFISDSMARSMAIETEEIGAQTFTETLKVYGKLELAPSATRNISARFPGEVKNLYAVLGQRVKKGQRLLTIEGNESLREYHVYSPIDGVVTQQETGVGEQTSDRTLLSIVDTSRLIAEVDVFPSDREKVKLGAQINIQVPGNHNVIKSQLFDALFDVHPTQAIRFRAEVDNKDGMLKVGQFVTAEILLGSYQVPLAVKTMGLQSFRDFTVVYAKVGEEYEVRMLELGRKTGAWVEVLGGISTGTEYVAKNSYIIKADIDKSGASHDH